MAYFYEVFDFFVSCLLLNLMIIKKKTNIINHEKINCVLFYQIIKLCFKINSQKYCPKVIKTKISISIQQNMVFEI